MTRAKRRRKKKINDTIYDSMSDHVKTPQEQLLGQHINFSA